MPNLEYHEVDEYVLKFEKLKKDKPSSKNSRYIALVGLNLMAHKLIGLQCFEEVRNHIIEGNSKLEVFQSKVISGEYYDKKLAIKIYNLTKRFIMESHKIKKYIDMIDDVQYKISEYLVLHPGSIPGKDI